MAKVRNGEFGRLLKQHRLKTGKTLRQFCQENEFDPGNMSKIERGVLAPPTTRKLLDKYAAALNLKEGTDDWFEFYDVAAAQAGRIPDDVLTSPKVVEKLPVFFRTLRGQKVADEDLDALVKLIQES